MKRLEIFPTFPGWDACPLKGYSLEFCQVFLTYLPIPIFFHAIRHLRLWHSPFIHLDLLLELRKFPKTSTQLRAFRPQPLSSILFWVTLVCFSSLASTPVLFSYPLADNNFTPGYRGRSVTFYATLNTVFMIDRNVWCSTQERIQDSARGRRMVPWDGTLRLQNQWGMPQNLKIGT